MHVIKGFADNPVEFVRVSALKLAESRVLYAETFVAAKAAWRGSQPLSDGTAHQMAISATKDEVTVHQAELEIALHMMRKN
jgi:predicted regulator of Ras-like GTPase activity (Roadblock/LC7/MglB family)